MKRRNSLICSIILIVCCASLIMSSCMASNGEGNDFENGFADKNYPDANAPAEDNYDAEMSNPGDEDYGKFIENEFIKTQDTAVSTFSADVDTASYAYFRKLVNSGYSINELVKYAGNSIRTEEMINYFDYEGVAPKDNELFGVKSVIAQCPWNETAQLLCVTLNAMKAEPSKGNNLVFLIDVSGSMSSEDKLPLLKKSFEYLTANLTEHDTVSIVTYSGSERVVLEGCSGSKSEIIMNAVNSLGANGSTNGEAGLTKAYEIAKRYYIEGGNNRIIMASDGDLNVGISSKEDLTEYISQKRDEGVYLSILGFGTGNYKDSTMEALADNGNGVYYYIDGTSEAEKVFGTDLTSTLYTVAEDVKLQLTFNAEYIDAFRLVGYENRLLKEEDFTDDTKDAGEIGSGHTVTVCYELILKAEPDALTEKEWMTLAVAYKKPSEDVSNYNDYSIGYSSYSKTPDAQFKFICNVIKTAMILHKSVYAENITIESVLSELMLIELSGDSEKLEFLSLVQKLSKAE